jgi:hypothetical protein
VKGERWALDLFISWNDTYCHEFSVAYLISPTSGWRSCSRISRGVSLERPTHGVPLPRRLAGCGDANQQASRPPRRELAERQKMHQAKPWTVYVQHRGLRSRDAGGELEGCAPPLDWSVPAPAPASSGFRLPITVQALIHIYRSI